MSSSSSSRRKGQTVHSEARKMVKRIAQKCDEEAQKRELLHPLHKANARVSEYTGLSPRTITRIRNECSDSRDGSASSPGSKRPKSIGKRFHCTEDDKSTIRNIIHDFYVEKKIVPSGPKLLYAIREKIAFPWKLHTLHKLLKSMGYKWKKSNNVRKILIERPNIVAWRGKYLKALNHYRKENKSIVYVDETWVDNTLCFGKCWQSDDMLGVVKNTNSSHRLIIVHAGGKNGFISGASLILAANTAIGDYHGQMDAHTFEKWVSEKLLPNVPERSVIVMDNAPYHCIQINRPPSKYASKSDMINWLLRNNVPYCETMKKYELSELIERHRPTKNAYKIDETIKSRGHVILRLPPYMCELSPIELAWAGMKRKIRENNPSTLTLDALKTLAQRAIDSVTATEWENFCRHTEEIERKYWEKDNLLETVMDNFDLNVEDNSTEEDITDDEDSSSESS